MHIFVDRTLELGLREKGQRFKKWVKDQTSPVTIEVDMHDSFGARKVVATKTVLSSATCALDILSGVVVLNSTVRDFAIAISDMPDNTHSRPNKEENKAMFLALFDGSMEECLRSNDPKWDILIDVIRVPRRGSGGGGGGPHGVFRAPNHCGTSWRDDIWRGGTSCRATTSWSGAIPPPRATPPRGATSL